MAFTDEEAAKIRFYLGYPTVYRETNFRLEGAIEIAGNDPPAKAIIQTLLLQLDKQYGSSPGGAAQIDQVIQQAGLKVVESADDKVEYGETSKNAGGSSSAALNANIDVARRLVSALSSYLGVPIANNVFGTAGYSGDGWTGTNNMSRTWWPC